MTPTDSSSELPTPLVDTQPDMLVELDRGATYRGHQVGEVVSRSGVGVLYLALREDERCYLRVLNAAQIDTDELILAKADLAKLREVVHRNVARVVDGGVIDGELHYTLEARGTTSLLDIVRAGRPLEEAELVWVARGLAAGLAALHAAGLHHGGLNPSVVVITLHGAILVDLGWEGRFGSAEQLPIGQAQRADLLALADLLTFAAAPVGDSPAEQWPRLAALLQRLTLKNSDAFQSAEQAAVAFKTLGQTLGLPDPMAPGSLRALLERTGDAPLEASREVDGLALSTDQPTPLVEPPPSDLDALMVSTVNEDEDEDELGSADLSTSNFGSESEVTVIGGPPAESGIGSEDGLLTSADRQKSTLAYAKQVLKDSDSISTSELGVDPHSETNSDSDRAERGDAPGLGSFGDYELVRELEAFPASTRFIATHPDQPKGVVVEVIVPDALPGDTAQRRFLRGAETAQAVQVEGIARVLGSGKIKEWCYVAYDRTPTPTLADVLADGPHAGGRAPQIMAQALRLLEQAHHQGVVHGAIEPEAIHVATGDRVTLSGFGFGRLPPHARLATRYYPDNREERDEAGDLQAAARILYEALTGGLPSQASAPFWFKTPPPPSVMQPDLAPALDTICLTALGASGSPYPSAGNFAEDLEHLSHSPRHARPLDARTRVGLVLARGGAALVVALLLAAVGAVLAGVGASSLIRTEPRLATQASATPNTSPSLASSGELARLREQVRRGRKQEATAKTALTRLQEETSRLKASQAKRNAAEALRLVELGESDLAGGAPDAATRAFRAALLVVPQHARAT
ncbi:MAG: hypothetical protein JKY65_04795, partial [Planctomycetes bacterium]|nr:hypothetical protein [Planctomycetota bacterium]